MVLLYLRSVSNVHTFHGAQASLKQFKHHTIIRIFSDLHSTGAAEYLLEESVSSEETLNTRYEDNTVVQQQNEDILMLYLHISCKFSRN